MSELRELISTNIRYYRDKLNISQKQLAESVGFASHQIVSQIENGQRDVKAWELYAIAQALYVDSSLLTSDARQRTETLVLWRKNPSVSREVEEAEFLKRCHQYSLLERLCKYPVQDKLPNIEVNFKSMTFDDSKQMGREIRERFGLGSYPAACLYRVLQDDFNVKIFHKDFGVDGSAASSKGDFGAAILINSNEKYWRRNYSYAHELFHLITWASIDSSILDNHHFVERIEQLAEIFASTLLIPEESLRSDLYKYMDGDNIEEIFLIEIARKFSVSTDALLWRMCNMSMISEEDVRSLIRNKEFKEIDRKSRVDSSGTDTPRIPERFVRLAFHALQDGVISRAKVAEFFGVSLVDLSDFFMEYDLDDTKDYKTSISTVRR